MKLTLKFSYHNNKIDRNILLLISGTDATHAEHIETIKNRCYVGVQQDGTFLPGQLGMGLVEGKDIYLVLGVIITIEGCLISAVMTLIKVLCWEAKCQALFC